MKHLWILLFLVSCATPTVSPEQAKALAKHNSDQAQCYKEQKYQFGDRPDNINSIKQCMKDKGYHFEN